MLQTFSLTNVLRSGIVVCLCLSLIGVSSCSDDGDDKETSDVLISFDVADNQLVGDEVGIIILSDDDGNIIASAQYHNGEHVELKSTTFKGEKFVLTEALMLSENAYPITLWTYPQVERGTWSVYHNRPEFAEIPDANLSFSNAVVGSYRIATNGNSGVPFANDATFSYAAPLIKSPSKLYIEKRNDNPDVTNTYRLFPSVTSGDNATIDLSQVDQPLTKTTIDFPQGATYLGHYLEGYAVPGDYTERYRLGSLSSESTSLTFEHPGNTFASYYSETYYTTEDFYYVSGSLSALYNVTTLQYDATFSISNGKLNCSSSGNYDFLTTSFRKDSMTRWIFLFPKGNDQSIAIPNLSDTVTALLQADYPGASFEEVMPDLTVSPSSYYVMEYKAIDGYDGLKNYIKSATLGFDGLVNGATNFISMEIKDNSTGRTDASKTRATRIKW
jgi:hypothetical protein